MKNSQLEQYYKVLFITLLEELQMKVLTGLGKIKDPETEKYDKNQDQARLYLEMLEMLRDKTRGNISEDEVKILDQMIDMLKLDINGNSK